MSIRIGTTEPKAIKVGNRDVRAVYAGVEKVWPIVNDATVLKLKYLLQNASVSPVPYEVTDKTESPQWRFWMQAGAEPSIQSCYTEMIIDEIPDDAEIKFVLVGYGGRGHGSIQGYGAGGGGEVIQYTLPAGSLKAGDNFRVGRRKFDGMQFPSMFVDFMPSGGDVFSAGDARNGGEANKNVGGFGWVDGKQVTASNDGGSGAGGASPDSNGDRGIVLAEWGETFGEGGFGGNGSRREFTIGMGGEGVRGGSQIYEGQRGGVAFQSNVPIEVTL